MSISFVFNFPLGFDVTATELQKGSAEAAEKILSELLNDTRTLREVDYDRFESTRYYLHTLFSEILESPWPDKKEIENIGSALYRVALAIYKAQYGENNEIQN